jgi:AraC-like DNA-binding protein
MGPTVTAPPLEIVRRAPARPLAGLVVRLTGYREPAPGWSSQREAAPLVAPLIISFGSPFLVALGREPGGEDRQSSFAAGLHPGPVYIRSDGRAECVQIDFTPLGAFGFFGVPMAELTSRMVDIVDILGREGGRLRERLAASPDWEARFDLVEGFIAERVRHQPSGGVAFAYARLARSGGAARIETIAADLGWSRKHLAGRFRAEIGLGPKTVGRMMRFNKACRLAASARSEGWASIAAASGYADQAHLAREFTEFAAEPPTAWAQRIAAVDERLLRLE